MAQCGKKYSDGNGRMHTCVRDTNHLDGEMLHRSRHWDADGFWWEVHSGRESVADLLAAAANTIRCDDGGAGHPLAVTLRALADDMAKAAHDFEVRMARVHAEVALLAEVARTAEGTPQDIIAAAVRFMDGSEATKRILRHVIEQGDRVERAHAALAAIEAEVTPRIGVGHTCSEVNDVYRKVVDIVRGVVR